MEMVGFNLRYHFWNRGEILNKMAMFKYLSFKEKFP